MSVNWAVALSVLWAAIGYATGRVEQIRKHSDWKRHLPAITISAPSGYLCSRQDPYVRIVGTDTETPQSRWMLRNLIDHFTADRP